MEQLGWTTLEQSKKLIEAGLDPNTADMAILKDNTYSNALSVFNGATFCQNYNEIKNKTNYIPCWSLGALLTLMPNTMKDPLVGPVRAAYHLTLKENVYNAWECNYEHFSFGGLYEFPAQPTPIEAVVYTILWLLERGYIGKA